MIRWQTFLGSLYSPKRSTISPRLGLCIRVSCNIPRSRLHSVTWKRRTQELTRHNQSRPVDPFNGFVSAQVRELMDMPGEKIIRLIRS